ncbi:MAG: hypothetical protein AB7W59_11965 [Acidimicrobiia bacterium]
MTRSGQWRDSPACSCGRTLAKAFVLLGGTRRDRMWVCDGCARGFSIAVPGSSYRLHRLREGAGGWAAANGAGFG